jgi:hypothetical protein
MPATASTKATLLCLALITASLAGQDQAQDQPQLQSTFQQGMAAMKAGHPEQAEKLFRQTTAIDPAFAPGFLDLGLAQIRQGKLPEAAASNSTPTPPERTCSSA